MKNISIIIPVKDEAKHLVQKTRILEDYVKTLHVGYEIIIVENGSTDNTLEILRQMALANEHIVYLTIPRPSYGEAMRKGINKAKYDFFIYSIDLTMGLSFLRRGITALEQYPMVIGSRYHKDSKVQRNRFRHWVSHFYPPLINFLFGTDYTDFDGIKAFQKDVGKRLVRLTKSPRNFFFTEMLVIGTNSDIPHIELSINHIEKRKSRFNVRRLILGQIHDLIKYYWRLKRLRIPYKQA
jgi:glycosyltransferase involved in cell wall biosynthesis